MQAHLQQAETDATRILQTNRTLLEAMATALVKKGVLTGQPLEDFLDQLSGEPSLTTATEKPTEISSADEENIKLS